MNLKEIDALLKCKPYVKQDPVTTDNSATLVNALAEIERLNVELKNTTEFHNDIFDRLAYSVKQQAAAIERKDAALRVALDALETAALNDPARNDDLYYDNAIIAVKEALA